MRTLLDNPQEAETQIDAQRAGITELRGRLASLAAQGVVDASHLLSLAGTLVRHGVWIIGGDGWAYDIGFGGVDQVLSAGRDVNILVLDTEVYSNTGGQASKATPRGRGGEVRGCRQEQRQEGPRRDRTCVRQRLRRAGIDGCQRVADDQGALEADAWPGPSLVIAYSTCIAHGIDMSKSMSHQKDAVKSGYWPLYRFRPSEIDTQPFKLDSHPPSIPVRDFAATESRFAILERTHPERAAALAGLAQADVDERWRYYEQLAGMHRVIPHVPDPEVVPEVESDAGYRYEAGN